MLFLLLAAVAVPSTADRPKVKDIAGHFLARISDIPVGSCGDDTYFGLGIMNGTLEKCSMWQETDEDKQEIYETYKCKHLRVNAHMVDGKCVCKGPYRGSLCLEMAGCADDTPYVVRRGCAPNACQHDGELAVGSKEVECVCKVPWDGRYCERLACFRKTDHGADLRFANDGVDKCKCGRHYKGENCDQIISCQHKGELVDDKCICPEGYGGEICNLRCPKGQIACSSSFIGSVVAFVLSFLLAAI